MSDTPITDAAEIDALTLDIPGQQVTDKVVRSIVCRLIELQLAEKEAALAGLLNAEHCPSCQNQGVIVIQTGGCDSDGENDTRCREQEQCEWCYTTKNSFFNVRASLPQSAKHDGK